MRLLAICLALTLIAAAPAGAAITRGWSPTGSMNVARQFHGGVLLDNGKFLVAGGETPNGVTRTAELYDPATGTWSSTGSMSEARHGFAMVKLQSGKVLAAGGGANPALAELYDPATGTWQGVGPMPSPHLRGVGALLGNGKVLVAGGLASSTTYSADSALFDPASNTWTSAGTVPGSARADQTVARLPRDRIMVAGGYGANGFSNEVGIYGSSGWSAGRPSSAGRNYPVLSPLAGGRMLLSGGATNSSEYSNLAEIYDPELDSWTLASSMAANHFAHAAIALGSGKVLAVSGYQSPAAGAGTSTELYDPVTNSWAPAGSVGTGRWVYASALLPDGRVLIAGGATGGGGGPTGMTASAEVWTATTSLITDPALGFGDQRIGPGAVAGAQVTNTGEAPLLTADFAIGGIHPGDFSVNGDRCRVVAPGATCALDVRFAPAAIGNRSATLTFSANTAGGVHAVPLSGRGVADTDADGVLDGADRCARLKGPAARQGCPAGLVNDPSIRYRAGKRGIRVLVYYVKATTGSRVRVSCSRGCKPTVTKGRGSKRVRITRLTNRRLTNGAKITITVSKAGRLTTTVIDRVTRGRRLEGRARCTQPGTKSPRIGC